MPPGNFLATLGFHPFCFFGVFKPAGLNTLIMKGFQMSRRAVIYIRTSSESQGANSSPIEQEVNCLYLAQEKGLQVIRIYRCRETCANPLTIDPTENHCPPAFGCKWLKDG